MKRLLHKQLLNWASQSRRKPLLLRGARQVGKTTGVRDLAKDKFSGYLAEINLEKRRDAHRIFEGALDPKRMLADLELLLGKRLVPGETLLFLDEIQACPRAITALRYFYEELPTLHVIGAGSLIEFVLGDISVPVGRLQYQNVFPMSFLEFLWARGKEQLAEILLQDPLAPAPPSQIGHALLLDELRAYFLVGGMPEAVAAFVKSGSYHESFAVHEELVATYRDDFAKYRPRVDPECLDLVLKGVAKGVGQQMTYTHLAEGYSQPTLKKAFDLLCQARLIQKIEAASPAGLPLGASANPRKCKALMLDIGLMHHLCNLPVESALKENLLSLYKGAMAEQFVGQELTIAQDRALYYWVREKRGSSAEVDYLLAKDGHIIPIEVKGGAAGHLKSLHLLLEAFPGCKEGWVFSEAPASLLPEHNLRFLPLYDAYWAALPRMSE